MIRFAVCDDEKFMLDDILARLSLYMEKRKLSYKAYRFANGAELLESNLEFDVIFLDIQMEVPDGMETARRLRENGCKSLIIFITVLKECVFDSFEVEAYDYLVKPVTQERFFRTMDRAALALKKRRERNLVVKSNHSCQVIPASDIVYCEVLGRKVYLHQKNGEVVSWYERIGVLEDDMDGRFFRCHRSYLVNLDYVRGCRSGRVLLAEGGEIPVSRLREQELAQALLAHMKERRQL